MDLEQIEEWPDIRRGLKDQPLTHWHVEIERLP
jgi:hypothetical protein